MLATNRFSILSSRLLSRNIKVKIYKTIILPDILFVHSSKVCQLYSGFPSPKTKFRHLSLSLVSSSVSPWFVMLRLTPSIYLSLGLPLLRVPSGSLYGCETWSLTLREEHRLRVFENRVLRRIFGPKRDEVTGEWRKLHNEELHSLYSSPDIIRQIRSR
jgi:hypothetical protein